MKAEYRFAELGPIAEGRVLSGIAVPYNSTAEVVSNGRRVRERFAPGSAYSTGQAVLNVQHERARPLAREPDTLTIESRADGLFIRATLPETREADDTLTLVRSKILRGLSVEFNSLKETRVSGVRVIQSALITGIGIVDSGAYPRNFCRSARHGQRRRIDKVTSRRSGEAGSGGRERGDGPGCPYRNVCRCSSRNSRQE